MTARDQDGKYMLAFCVVGITTFGFLTLFGVRNMIKFRTSLTFSLYLFYVIALLVSITRILFYLNELSGNNGRLQEILSVLPGAFLLGVTTA
jgi:hypothetical protein